MVLISKQERRLVYEYLLQEGVVVVKKDVALEKHQELPVGNLKVMMLCRSLQSKGLLDMQFNWQWFYYYLTKEGIKTIRDYLGAPSFVMPVTYKAPTKPTRSAVVGEDTEDRPRRGGFGRGRRPQTDA